MSVASRPASAERVAVPILVAISISHLLNDLIQSLLPAIYPILKSNFHLDFGQIGLLTLTFQVTASLLQPMIGTFTDRRPQPFSLCPSRPSFPFLLASGASISELPWPRRL